MAALNVTPKDVVYALLANNFQSAAEQKSDFITRSTFRQRPRFKTSDRLRTQ